MRATGRILISVDMEGIAGVAVGSDVTPGTTEYEQNRRLMTAEASAAVRGALAWSADLTVAVADAHGPFCNLLADALDPRALLVRGRPRPLGMVTDVGRADALICVGYHGRAGTATSVLSHTIASSCIADVRCNGRSIGEIGLNAGLAGHHGVPTILVCGDDTVAAEAQALIPGVATVSVKRALGASAAESLHPTEAGRRIEAAVPEALERAGELDPLRFPGAITLEIDLLREGMTEQPLLVPGLDRIGPRTVAYHAPDFATAAQVVRAVAILASPRG